MISVVTPPANMRDGIRPVNMRTDLAALADLIELAFKDVMDEGGRSSIREMRYMSQLGYGLDLLSRLNDPVPGLSEGFVAIVDGNLVANVSMYPAKWRREAGKAWMLVNVSTHPDYRKRGLARELMLRSMEAIRKKGASHAILQVDYDNHAAIHLYETLGFVRERAFTRWVRTALVSAPINNPELDDIFFTRPSRSSWRERYELVQRTRPNLRGGIGWLRPVHIRDFRPTIWNGLKNFLSLGDKEKLIVRDEDTGELLSLMWIERSFALSRTELTLFRQPDSDTRYAEALISGVLRRYRSSGFTIEHPQDESDLSEIFSNYRFRPHRSLWHMSYRY